MKQIILFQNPCFLSIYNGQMVVNRNEEEISRIPVEDIGMVILECQQVSLTEPLIVCMADNNVPLVCCDASHCPASISYPLKGNCLQGEIVRKQLSLQESVSSDLWKKIVCDKISAQIDFLKKLDMPYDKMDRYLPKVMESSTSVEAASFEGAAAKCYFELLFGKTFRRDRYGKTPNDYLNYGYTILRCAVIRELIASGLFLGLGLYHSNRSNEFPLADDVMEPYRPYVDRIVYDLFREGESSLNSETRQRLVKVLSLDVSVGGYHHSLSDALRMTSVSVMKVLTGEMGVENVVYPVAA